MKSTLYIILVICCSTFLFFTLKTSEAHIGFTNTSAAQKSNGKYQLKSGIIYMDIENGMMPGISKSILYFDNYGNKECTETNMEMEMMGQKVKVHQLGIIADGYIYTVDLEKKIGTKMKISSQYDPSKIDYNNLNSDVMKEYNLKKEGTETLLGKKCDIYSMSHAKMKLKGKTWIWNGINMKSEMTMSGISIKTTTTKIEENVSVSSSKFVVPKGIKIQDM